MILTFQIPDDVIPDLAFALGLHKDHKIDPEKFIELVLRSQMRAAVVNYRTQIEVDAARQRIADRITGI